MLEGFFIGLMFLVNAEGVPDRNAVFYSDSLLACESTIVEAQKAFEKEIRNSDPQLRDYKVVGVCIPTDQIK